MIIEAPTVTKDQKILELYGLRKTPGTWGLRQELFAPAGHADTDMPNFYMPSDLQSTLRYNPANGKSYMETTVGDKTYTTNTARPYANAQEQAMDLLHSNPNMMQTNPDLYRSLRSQVDYDPGFGFRAGSKIRDWLQAPGLMSKATDMGPLVGGLAGGAAAAIPAGVLSWAANKLFNFNLPTGALMAGAGALGAGLGGWNGYTKTREYKQASVKSALFDDPVSRLLSAVDGAMDVNLQTKLELKSLIRRLSTPEASRIWNVVRTITFGSVGAVLMKLLGFSGLGMAAGAAAGAAMGIGLGYTHKPTSYGMSAAYMYN